MRETYSRPARILLALVVVFALWWATAATSGAQAPVVNLSPASGPIGTKVTVSACGMTPGNVVQPGDIMFGVDPWSTQMVRVDSSGCMCAMPLTVPFVDGYGSYAVTVYDGSVTATGTFTVTQPNISVWPTSGYKGDTLTVSGTGWMSPSVVTVYFQDSKMDALYPDAAGNFVTQFTVPLTAAPSNVITARDSIGNVGPAMAFNLNPPGLSLSPISGPPGTSVLVHGYGFEPFSGVESLTFAGSTVGEPGLITNDTGAFVTNFQAPGMPSGGYIVSATVADVSLDMCFTIFAQDVWVPLDDLPTPIEDALAPISDQLVRVWGYCNGEWRMYDPADPLGNGLAGLVKGRGYWIKVNGDCTLIFRNLQTGWNNVGW